MAENWPPVQEGATEPFTSFTSLPHAHPATSFSSNNSNADLARQAMPPPPPHPSSEAPVLNASTPVFEPRVLNPFRLCDAFTEQRDAWLKDCAAQFHTLVQHSGNALQSLTLARSLEQEMSVIDRAIGINEEGHRLYDHIVKGLVGLCGPEDVELGLVRTDWQTYMSEEFHADAQRVERCGRDLHKRKAIVQMQMLCKKQMRLHPNISVAEAMVVIQGIQGILGTVGAAIIPMASGAAEPAYNQMYPPHANAQPHFSGVAWQSHDLLQTPHGAHSKGQPQHNRTWSTPQCTLAAAYQLDCAPGQPAFAHQLDIVSSPTPMPMGTGRRNNSFGTNAQGSRQEFQAAMYAGRYDPESKRRPTNASQGSSNGYARSRSWESNSSTSQRRGYTTAQNDWQEGHYIAGGNSQGKSSSQSSNRAVGGIGQEEPFKRDKGKGRATSSYKHRSESPSKARGRQESKSPGTNTSGPARQDSVGGHSSHAGSSADHSHPGFNESGPSSRNGDRAAAWDQLQTPKASDQVRSEDSDVTSLNLDDPTISDAPEASLNVFESSTSGDSVPQQLQTEKNDSALREKEVPTLVEASKEEQSLPGKSRTKHKEKTADESGDKTSKPMPDEASVLADATSKGSSEKVERTEDGVNGGPLKRKESNEWQVAQGRRQHQEPAEKPKQGKGNGPNQERELSARGEKKGKGKQRIGSAQPRAQDVGQGFEGAEGGKAKGPPENPPRKGRAKESPEPSPTSGIPSEPSVTKQRRLNDSNEAAFPCLPSPATPSTNKNAVQPNTGMSWMEALQSADHRVEAEKLRLAAETDLPMSPDAILVRKPSLQVDTKTPGPKVKVTSGELRATATPFTPPPMGSSLLDTGTQRGLSAPAINNNLLIPTYAQRAAAASARESEAAAIAAVQQTKKQSKTSTKTSMASSSTKTGSGRNRNLKSTDSYPDLASKFQQKGGSKLNLSDHAGSMSAPMSIAGSVSSPSISSVKSVPSTPMVSTWAQRAASVSKYVAAPLTKPTNDNEAPLSRPGNVTAPKRIDEPRRKSYKLASSLPDSTPKKYKPAPPLPDSAEKVAWPPTSTSGLATAGRNLSYASTLASPAPLVMTPIVDDASKKGEKATSMKDGKSDGSTSVGASVPGGKKGSTGKVCDPKESENAVEDSSSLGEISSQGESADASIDSESKAEDCTRTSEQRTESAAHGEDGHKAEAGVAVEESPNEGRLQEDETGRSAGGGNYKNFDGKLSKGKQTTTVQTKLQATERGEAADAGDTKSAEESLIQGSDDSQATVGSRGRNRKSKSHSQRHANRISKGPHASSEAHAAAPELKSNEAKEEKSSTKETPTKISWADDDDDEWAGFETLQETTSEVKKEGKERKGG